MDKDGIHKGPNIISGDVYVDGSRIGDVGSVVIKDRKLMSKDGILVTILNINPMTRKLLIKPNITTRGFILVNENEALLKQIENKATEVIIKELQNKKFSYNELKSIITTEVNSYVLAKTGRKPIILPVLMDIKSND